MHSTVGVQHITGVEGCALPFWLPLTGLQIAPGFEDDGCSPNGTEMMKWLKKPIPFVRISMKSNLIREEKKHDT